MYNICMTSVPIMFYSVFDYEYKKVIENPNTDDDNYNKIVSKGEKSFMKDFDLYSIGLNQECFDAKIFLSWIVYALI